VVLEHQTNLTSREHKPAADPPDNSLTRGDAHKKGEVVEPAGGETGVPRCLAEVRKLLKAASFHYIDRLGKKPNPLEYICPEKNEKNLKGLISPI